MTDRLHRRNRGRHLGRIHARLLRQRPDVDLVGIVEPQAAAREAASREFWVPGVADFRALPRTIEAAIVAAPTTCHHALALQLLRNDVHVLVEKPLTTTSAEAEELVDVAARRQRVLQVGHVERFNPALDAARSRIARPRSIDAVRASGYSFRSTDIGVVLDLMIHDLDVVLSLVREPVVEVAASGCTAVGPQEDQAQVRLVFAQGCVANLTASRISQQPQRVMSIYHDDGLVTIDFQSSILRCLEPGPRLRQGVLDVQQLEVEERNQLRERFFADVLPAEEVVVDKRNAIEDEHSDFVEAIRQRRAPRVSGLDGLRALDVAERILAQLASPVRHLRWTPVRSTIPLPESLPARTPAPLRKAG
ncbi:MAG: Gfo/Idh/MocA family oxidoreductase [Pirellulales bacterium]